MWSGRRLTKIQATTRPDYLWPEIWIRRSKATEKIEKQEWTSEESKLDNARGLRGIYFIDPEDGENKDTIKNAIKKLEVPMEAAMLSKMGTRNRLEELQAHDARGITESNGKSWKRMNPQESVWNHIMKITPLREDSIR